jgi:hypothetical protein
MQNGGNRLGGWSEQSYSSVGGASTFTRVCAGSDVAYIEMPLESVTSEIPHLVICQCLFCCN